MVKESLKLNNLIPRLKVITHARVGGGGESRPIYPRSAKTTPRCDPRVVARVPWQGSSASSTLQGYLAVFGDTLDLDRADPLYLANQKRIYTRSTDLIGPVYTYQVQYLWHLTVLPSHEDDAEFLLQLQSENWSQGPGKAGAASVHLQYTSR